MKNKIRVLLCGVIFGQVYLKGVLNCVVFYQLEVNTPERLQLSIKCLFIQKLMRFQVTTLIWP